eukprot:gene10038-12307_t
MEIHQDNHSFLTTTSTTPSNTTSAEFVVVSSNNQKIEEYDEQSTEKKATSFSDDGSSSILVNILTSDIELDKLTNDYNLDSPSITTCLNITTISSSSLLSSSPSNNNNNNTAIHLNANVPVLDFIHNHNLDDNFDTILHPIIIDNSNTNNHNINFENINSNSNNSNNIIEKCNNEIVEFNNINNDRIIEENRLTKSDNLFIQNDQIVNSNQQQINNSNNQQQQQQQQPMIDECQLPSNKTNNEYLPSPLLVVSSGRTNLSNEILQVTKDHSFRRNENKRSSSVPIIRPRIQRPIRQRSPHAMNERPLLHAVLVQEEIKTLVNHDDVNTKDTSGNSVLHRVSIIGNALAIKHVVVRGGRVNAVNNSGMTPLHYAACANLQSVEILLYYGSSPNAKDVNGETPLYYAVDRGQVSVVSLLLSRGAKVNITNKNLSRNAIHVAAIKGPIVILNNNNTSTAANIITQCSNLSNINGTIDLYLSCCELLLQRGANIFAQDIHGSTALHIASRHGKKNLVELILFYARQLKNKPTQSLSASTSSAQGGSKKELKSEMIFFMPDNKGRIPLHSAAMGGHSRILESLLGTGKKCSSVKDDIGMTPLCLASLYGHFDCVEYLYSVDKKPNHFFKFFSSIDDSKTPVDPLGNDYKFWLDGDYSDLVFIVDGKEIYAHTILLRQFKCFRDMISCNRVFQLQQQQQLLSQQQQQQQQQQPFFNPSSFTNSNPYYSGTASYTQHFLNSYCGMNPYSQNDEYYINDDFDDDYFSKPRSRMNSVVNPSGLIRIQVEKGIPYDIFRGLLHFVYTSEIPRELITSPGKLSELMDLANQFDIETLNNLCVDTLSQNSNGRIGTLEMAKYLYKQVNSKTSSDVTIICENGYIVQAHGVILAARCPYFKMHFETFPLLSKSSISLFPSNNNNQFDNPNQMRKLSCPSSPALSDIPNLGWVIDISEANHKAITALLEYIYCGSIVSANPTVNQPSMYYQKNPNDLEVIDLMILSKLAFTLNLSTLQQYCAVLLYNMLDPSKVVTVIKTIFSFDSSSQGWGKSASVDQMWNVCIEWMVKKTNWNEMLKYDSFLKLGQRFIKEIKKERKDKKKKLKNLEKQRRKREQQKKEEKETQLRNSIKFKSRELFKSKSTLNLSFHHQDKHILKPLTVIENNPYSYSSPSLSTTVPNSHPSHDSPKNSPPNNNKQPSSPPQQTNASSNTTNSNNPNDSPTSENNGNQLNSSQNLEENSTTTTTTTTSNQSTTTKQNNDNLNGTLGRKKSSFWSFTKFKNSSPLRSKSFIV